MSVEYCLLCGHVIPHSAPRRYKSSQDILNVLKRSCHPTQYAYTHLLQSLEGIQREGKDTNQSMHVTCTPCANWFRRVTLSKFKFFIPVDDVLSFVNSPSERRLLPDKRTMIRVFKSLCMTFSTKILGGAFRQNTQILDANLYLSIFSTPSLLLLIRILQRDFFSDCKIEGNVESLVFYFTNDVRHIYKNAVVDTVLKVWWLQSGMPTLLPNKKCAKLTRRMLGKYVKN